MQSTYSFLDLSGAIASPVGPYIFTGDGIGEGGIVVEMSQERTAHDTGADGSIMVSKMAGNNGTINISVQQTSNLHKWLLGWYNALVLGDTSIWAATGMLLRNVSDGTSHIISGVSPGKKPGMPYHRQGQNITWALMAADIQSVPI